MRVHVEGDSAPDTLVNLEALPWATNGRNGVAFRAESISSAPSVQSVKSA